MNSNNCMDEGSSAIFSSRGDEFSGASLLPDQLCEPELSAFRIFHARIAQAQERLQAANEGWNAFAPVIAARYGLSPADQIDAEGRIHRAPKVEDR